MVKRKKIDDTLDRVYKVLSDFIKNNGFPPSYRELTTLLGVTSTSTINYYLNKLEERHLIKKSGNKNRAIELINNSTKPNQKMQSIPLLGNVAAGVPILAVENHDDVFEVSSNLFKNSGQLFMLTIHGDSMINAGIYNKDKIIVRKQDTAENNEIIVAMIDGSVTCKRFFKEANRIKLQPENDMMKPIYCDNIEILGKVIGLIRNF